MKLGFLSAHLLLSGMCNHGTVKPPPTATSLQWPFFFGGQSIHSLLFQPLYNGHFLSVPKVAVVERFTCTFKISSATKQSVLHSKDLRLLLQRVWFTECNDIFLAHVRQYPSPHPGPTRPQHPRNHTKSRGISCTST